MLVRFVLKRGAQSDVAARPVIFLALLRSFYPLVAEPPAHRTTNLILHRQHLPISGGTVVGRSILVIGCRLGH